MKKRRWSPRIDLLEDRSTPAISLASVGGPLIVNGSASIAGDAIKLSVVSSDANFAQVQVSDGTTVLGTFPAAGLDIHLTDANDLLEIDLGGNTLPGSLVVELAGGENLLNVHSGTVTGEVRITGGSGGDNVSLLDLDVGSTSAVRNTYVSLYGASNDFLHVGFQSALSGYLFTDGINYITQDAGTSIGQNLVVAGAYLQNVVDLGGSVGGDVVFYSGGSTESATLYLRSSASLAGNIIINGGAGTDTLAVNLNGNTFGGNIIANLGGGDDVLNIFGGAVLGNISVQAGSGGDKVNLLNVDVGTAAAPKNVFVDLGAGFDFLYVGHQSEIFGNLSTVNVEHVNLDAANKVGGNVIVTGGSTGANVLDLGGVVAGDVYYYNSGSSDNATVLVRGTAALAGNIYINGSAGNDLITLSIGGGTFKGNVAALLGGGNDVLSITSGAILGNVSVRSGAGNDTVNILDLDLGTVGKPANLFVDLAAGFDILYVGFQSQIYGNVVTIGVDHVNVDAANKIGGDLLVTGDIGSANVVDLGGEIKGNVSYASPGSASATIVVRSSAVLGGNIFIKGGAGSDSLVLDLGGNTFKGKVSVDLGGGNDKLVIRSGDILGSVSVVAGGGDDVVHLLALDVGSAASPADVSVNLGGGSDLLYVGNQSHFYGNLFVQDVNYFTLDYFNTVDKTVRIGGDVTKTVADIRGTVGLDVVFASNLFSKDGNYLRIANTGSVGRDVIFQGTKLADTVIVEGFDKKDPKKKLGAKIGRNLSATMDGGNDLVIIGEGACIKGAATLLLGDGNDTVQIAGKIGGGPGLALHIQGHNGNDCVEIQIPAVINGSTQILMGDGDDKLVIVTGKEFKSPFFADGGKDKKDILNAKAVKGVAYKEFEIFP